MSRLVVYPRRLVAWPHRPGGERGSISAMVVVLIVMLFALAGLIYDGGAAINARQQAFDDAEQAARAGANQINEEHFRSTGEIQILEDAAAQAAHEYLAQLPDRSYDTVTVAPDADQVFVQVSRAVNTSLLQLVFVNSFTAAGNATAEAEVGILGVAP